MKVLLVPRFDSVAINKKNYWTLLMFWGLLWRYIELIVLSDSQNLKLPLKWIDTCSSKTALRGSLYF